MNNSYSLQQMILSAWPVLSVLWIMSIFSVTIIVDRWLSFRRAKANFGAFLSNLLSVIKNQGLDRALDFCRRYHTPLALVAGAILAQKGERQARERAAQHALQIQINQLESYLPALGTIASTAPFVGLFGTVIGIIRAFQDISTSMGGGPEVVAGGISEALITTAFGLFVAIPATMGYNYFIRRTQRLASEIDLAVYNLIETLDTEPERTHEG